MLPSNLRLTSSDDCNCGENDIVIDSDASTIGKITIGFTVTGGTGGAIMFIIPMTISL